MNQRMRIAISILLLLVISTLMPIKAFAKENHGYIFIRTVTLRVPAVTRTESGYVGVMSKLIVTVAAPGSGIVYVSADPLTELDMQAAARMAALVATTVTGFDYYSFDYFIRIESDTSIVGGPSASGAMAVAIMAALRGASIRSDFSMTGMVDPDITLGPVGGVPEKLLAAADSGVKVFVIPAGQEKSMDLNTGAIVDVVKLGSEKGVKVIPAETVIDAYVAATGDKEIYKQVGNIKARYTYPEWLKKALKASADEFRRYAEGNRTCLYRTTQSLPETVKQFFEKILQDIDNSLKEGEALYRKGLYYSAASRFFGAAIGATRGCLLAKILLSDNPVKVLSLNVTKFLESANNTLNIVEPYLRGLLYRSRNISDVGIQLAVATLIRVNDARQAILEVKPLINQVISGRVSLSLDIIDTIVSEAVYSYYRAITARQWLDLFRSHEGGTVLPPKRLQPASYTLLYFAQSTASYSAALGVPTPATSKLIEKAKRILSSANNTLDYIESLVYAIQGYSDTTIHMRAAFLAGNESIKAARKGLIILTQMARSKGLQPILPLLYMEYGDTLSGMAALRLYVQGASYALLLDSLVPGRPYTATTTGQPQPTQVLVRTKTVTATVVKTVTISVPKGSTGTVTEVPVTVTATGTITEKTITSTMVKTMTKTKTITVNEGTTASWAALFITALVALLAGAAASRVGKQ